MISNKICINISKNTTKPILNLYIILIDIKINISLNIFVN